MKTLLFLLGFILIFKSLRAVEVAFGEVDFRIRENMGHVQIELTFAGHHQTAARVTLEVVPMSLSQYVDMAGVLPDGVDSDEDPAEPDLDFNSTSQLVTIGAGEHSPLHLNIDIYDDEVSEFEEVFLVHLRDATNSSGEGRTPEVTLGRDVSIVRIVQSASKRAQIWLSTSKLVLREGRPVNDDQLFIEVDGQIEPTVSVKISLSYTYFTSSEDIEIPAIMTITSNSSRRIPIPVRVFDDHIAEEEEMVSVRLHAPTPNKHLYQIDWKRSRTNIYIEDNDVPRLGFKPRGDGNMEMMEGDSKELCLVLLEPPVCTMYMMVSIYLSPDSPTDVMLLQNQTFYLNHMTTATREHCFEVEALNNTVINLPTKVRLDIATEIFLVNNFVSGAGYVEIEPGLLVIRDTDGVPSPPEHITVRSYGGQVSVLWEAHPSELQPVDKFVVTVQATPTPHNVIRSRREVKVPSLAPGEYWEHETNKTNIVLRITDFSKSYLVSVCAVNGLGRMCGETQQVEVYPLKDDPSKGSPLKYPPSPDAEGVVGNKKTLSKPVVIAAAVIVPVMLLVLAMAVVGVVIMCKCYGGSKQYSPSRQGTPEENNYVKRVECVETTYIKRPSTSSSVSMEWTAGEPYCSPLNNTPKATKTPPVLGTPV